MSRSLTDVLSDVVCCIVLTTTAKRPSTSRRPLPTRDDQGECIDKYSGNTAYQDHRQSRTEKKQTTKTNTTTYKDNKMSLKEPAIGLIVDTR